MMNRDMQKALWRIQYLDFVIHETVLYLDGHPECKKALDYYKAAVKKHKECYADFTEKYGPLDAKSVESDSWTWINNPWPWETEGC